MTIEVTKVVTKRPSGSAAICHLRTKSEVGHSLIEAVIVLAIIALLTAMALPNVMSSRRGIRAANLPREVMARLRETRQYAMSQRQAFTFVYDDTLKQITIIDHNNAPAFVAGTAPPPALPSGEAVLADPLYPNTALAVTVLTMPMANGGISTADIAYGVPTVPTGITSTLADTTTPTALVANKFTITFQVDGSVRDANGNFVSKAMFFYDPAVGVSSASAISILGSSGRVKLWRYTPTGNTYAE